MRLMSSLLILAGILGLAATSPAFLLGALVIGIPAFALWSLLGKVGL